MTRIYINHETPIEVVPVGVDGWAIRIGDDSIHIDGRRNACRIGIRLATAVMETDQAMAEAFERIAHRELTDG